jgi:hypothetical protein
MRSFGSTTTASPRVLPAPSHRTSIVRSPQYSVSRSVKVSSGGGDHVRTRLWTRRVCLVDDVAARFAMSDDLDVRPEFPVHGVAAMVIVVPVRVDHVAHRLRRQLPQLRGHHPGRRWQQRGIDHDHVAIVDDEQGIALNRIRDRIAPYEAVDTVGDRDDVVWREERRRIGNPRLRSGDPRDQRDHERDKSHRHAGVDGLRPA